MAQVKKAKDALCEQIVELYVLRDFIKDCDLDIEVVEMFEKRLSDIILKNRTAYKALV